MAKAELNIKVNADNKQALSSIKEVKKSGIDAVEEIQNKNREAVKNLLGRFAVAGIAVTTLFKLVGKVGEQVTAYFSKGEVFTKWGEKAKISAHSVAYLKAQADSAGVSTEQFEKSLEDLANGRTSLSKLSDEWGKIGDKITTANKAQENFEKLALARAKNFSLFTESTQNFFGGIANGALEMAGFGGSQLSAIERSAYEGKSLEEALSEGEKARKGWHMPISQQRKIDAYNEAIAKKQADEISTRKRAIESTAVELAKAEMSAENRERIFKEATGETMTNDAIIALAQELKSRSEILADSIKDATEKEKKRVEEEKKQEEKEKKFNEEMLKTETAISDSFTSGGGLIGNASYAIRNTTGFEDMAKVANKQLSIQRSQQKTLEDVRAILKGE